MGFYGIMVVDIVFKSLSSQKCQAGFNERTATMGLKKCLSNLAAVGNLGQCMQVRSS
jgi:hypothetical protein